MQQHREDLGRGGGGQHREPARDDAEDRLAQLVRAVEVEAGYEREGLREHSRLGVRDQRLDAAEAGEADLLLLVREARGQGLHQARRVLSEKLAVRLAE